MVSLLPIINSGIESGVTAEKLRSLLETLPGMGAVSVTRVGLCHSYVWTIDWLQVGGDRPDIIINDTNVQVNSSSTTSGVEVWSADGY